MDETTPKQQKKEWQHIFPWVVLVLALILLALPAPMIRIYFKIWDNKFAMQQPGFSSDFGKSSLVAESPHFRILAYDQYADEKAAQNFLSHAESMYPKMVKFLELPESAKPVTAILLPQCDMSHGGMNFLTINTCNNKIQASLSNIFVHELTHTLMTTRDTALTNPLFSEGLAVTTDQRFQWGTFIIYDYHISLYEALRSGEFIPPSDLRYGVYANKYDSSTGLRYTEAGSFSGYLIDRYGMDKFLAIYKDSRDFEGIYNLSYDQLADGWLRSVKLGNLMLMSTIVLGGLAALGLISLAVTNGWRWFPAAIFGWLAFLCWSFLLGTSSAVGLLYMLLFHSANVFPIPYEVIYPIWAPAGLVLAALLGSIIFHWKKRAGKIVLWLTGAGPMIGFLLVPAIVQFFK